jgi:hypothetical protein
VAVLPAVNEVAAPEEAESDEEANKPPKEASMSDPASPKQVMIEHNRRQLAASSTPRVPSRFERLLIRSVHVLPSFVLVLGDKQQSGEYAYG